MREQRIFRQRDPAARHRHRIERRMSIGAADGVFAHPEDALIPLGPTPHLTLPEPEAGRNTVVSAGLSALFHASIVAAILMAGYLAPEAVDEIIPVTLLDSPKPLPKPIELPGSNNPPPAPRTLARRIPASAAAHAAASQVQATAAPAAVAAQVSAETLDMASVEVARAPTRVDMARVTSRPLAAHRPVAPTASAADIGPVRAFELNPEDLLAPPVDRSGPTEVETGAPVAIDAPTAFAQYAEVGRPDYAEAASIAAPSAVGVGTMSFGGEAIATGVSGDYLGGTGASGGASGAPGGPPGGTPGGTGTGAPSVPCLQSAHVVRYLKLVEDRTIRRWELPTDAAPGVQVVLRFKLDFAGTATDIRVSDASTKAIGKSAEQALREASPFPPLNDNVRCLIEKTLVSTFTHSAS